VKGDEEEGNKRRERGRGFHQFINAIVTPHRYQTGYKKKKKKGGG